MTEERKQVSVRGYRRLRVRKHANELALVLYGSTRNFPPDEQYGLTPQMRRAALSVPTNIVEGQASRSRKEFANFLNMTNRSMVETEYLVEIALALGYLSKEQYDEIETIRCKVGQFLNGLLRSLTGSVRTLGV